MMTVKKIEKIYSQLLETHEDNVKYWSEQEKFIMKTVESVINHREQSSMFTDLDVSRLKISEEFPDIKNMLLEKLSNLTLQHETKLLEHSDTFSFHNRTIQDLCSQVLECSMSSSAASVTQPRHGGDSSAAVKVEQCYRLSRLYNHIDLRMQSWVEDRHSDKTVWCLSRELKTVVLC